jgi:hypothetical protein
MLSRFETEEAARDEALRGLLLLETGASDDLSVLARRIRESMDKLAAQPLPPIHQRVTPTRLRSAVRGPAVPPGLPDACDELKQMLASVLANPDLGRPPVDEQVLHRSLCDYVGQLKAAHLPPERVLVTIMAIAHRAGVREGFTDEGLTPPPDALMQKIVGWCIAEYYQAH